MSPIFPQNICKCCDRPLPRAAVLRCPSCFAPVYRATGAPKAVCPVCDAPLPRAHAGRCTLCSVAARSRTMRRAADR